MTEINICSACLCTNRKMFTLNENNKKQCYLGIIYENLPPTKFEEDSVRLCWECNALLTKFANFKQLVQESFKKIHGLHHNKLTMQLKSKLTVKSEYLFSTTSTEEENAKFEIIPPLPNLDVQVKIEENYFSDDHFDTAPIKSNSSDEVILKKMNDSNKLLKPKKRKRKRLTLQSNYLKKREKKIKTKNCSKVTEGNGVYIEIELTKQEIEEERRVLGEEEEYRNAVFRCENCVLPFFNKDDLMDHYIIKHNAGAPHQCPICKCSFNFDQAYKYHRSKHTKRYKCVVCARMHHNKRAATKHYGVEHAAPTEHAQLTQNLEVMGSNIENNIQEHTNAEENGEQTSHPCGSCEKTFKYKTSLRKHLEAHSIESGAKRKPYCEPCRMSFKSTANLQKHVKTSFKHKVQLKMRRLKESNTEMEEPRIEKIRAAVASSLHMYVCDMCGQKFQWRGNLLRHVHSHVARAKGELVCEPCNRTFSSVATYQQHMKISKKHVLESDYKAKGELVCEPSNRTFSSVATYQQHMMISKKHVLESDYKYMCSDCGKKFANKIRLKDHINYEHLKNFTHTCVECQKVFKSHTSLYMHNQIVHEKGVTEKLCDHCGKHFPNASKLSKHIKVIHLGEMSYSCSVCAAKFGWASSLNRHMHKVHSRRDHKRELSGNKQGISGEGR